MIERRKATDRWKLRSTLVRRRTVGRVYTRQGSREAQRKRRVDDGERSAETTGREKANADKQARARLRRRAE